MNWKWNSIEGSQKGVAIFAHPTGQLTITMQSFDEARRVAKMVEDCCADAVRREREVIAAKVCDDLRMAPNA